MINTFIEGIQTNFNYFSQIKFFIRKTQSALKLALPKMKLQDLSGVLPYRPPPEVDFRFTAEEKVYTTPRPSAELDIPMPAGFDHCSHYCLQT